MRQTDRDWLVGRCHGNEGIFPASYVDIVRPLPSELVTISEAPAQVQQLSRLFVLKIYLNVFDFQTSPVRETPGASQQPQSTVAHCIARFDYLTYEPGDLRFSSGDVITLIEQVGDDWLKGEVHGHTGIFPLTYVEVVQGLPSATPAATTNNLSSPATTVGEFTSNGFTLNSDNNERT